MISLKIPTGEVRVSRYSKTQLAGRKRFAPTCINRVIIYLSYARTFTSIKTLEIQGLRCSLYPRNFGSVQLSQQVDEDPSPSKRYSCPIRLTSSSLSDLKTLIQAQPLRSACARPRILIQFLKNKSFYDHGPNWFPDPSDSSHTCTKLSRAWFAQGSAGIIAYRSSGFYRPTR